jgi:uncharacterized SAM-binding protein YcdF (DUF218 family)
MYFAITQLLQPFTILFLLLALALVALWLRRRNGRRLLVVFTALFVLLALLCMPVVGDLALGSLEWQYVPLPQRPENTEALVVLAGSIKPPDTLRPEPELNMDSYYRCLHAVQLYRQGAPCPVLVSGGKVDPDAAGPPCAEVMRTFLVQMGVAPTDVIVEGRSQTTYENAHFSQELLRERHVDRIVLVTDATHMFRAERCFRKQGLIVVPAPCNYRAAAFEWSLREFLPSAWAAVHFEDAAHEWAGSIWYWLQGRI